MIKTGKIQIKKEWFKYGKSERTGIFRKYVNYEEKPGMPGKKRTARRAKARREIIHMKA